MTFTKPLLGCLILGLFSGCALKIADRDLQASKHLNTPEMFVGPTRPHLVEFGRMLKAYLAGVEQDILVEIDLFHNDGLARELPTDIGACAREAVATAGINSIRAWPSWLTLPSAASGMGFRVNEPTKQEPTYRLIGSVSASNSLEASRDARVDGARDMKPIADAQLVFENLLGVTTITLQVALENSAGVAAPGGTTTFVITVERHERNRSASIYVGGSGVGGGQRLVVAQNAYAAVCETAAAAIIQLIGRATSVPYYRVAPEIFGTDRELDSRVLDSLHRMARQDVEQNIKRLLFAQGYKINLASPALAPEDRDLLSKLMRLQNLQVDDQAALIRFAFSLWKDLDYEEGADRVEVRLAESQRKARERELVNPSSTAKPSPPPAFTPTSFGWSLSDRVVILDLARIPSVETRKQVISVVRRCNGCNDVIANESSSRAAVRLSSNPVEVREVLRLSNLRLQYVWLDPDQKELAVAPFGVVIGR